MAKYEFKLYLYVSIEYNLNIYLRRFTEFRQVVNIIMSLGNGSKLEHLDRLIVKTVLENTIDQLAIVSGTIQHGLTLPQNQLQGPSSSNNVVHWNNTEKTLEEILLKEHKERIAAVN